MPGRVAKHTQTNKPTDKAWFHGEGNLHSGGGVRYYLSLHMYVTLKSYHFYVIEGKYRA